MSLHLGDSIAKWSPPTWLKFVWPYAVLLCACIAVYAVSLDGPFFFDDEHFILKNEHVKNLDVAAIYSSSVTEGARIDGNFYRPNQQLVFALLYRAFGVESSVPFHLFCILVHALNGALLFLLLGRLGFTRLGSLISSGFFLLHPVQTEAVSYVSGLAEPLATAFILSGLIGCVHAWCHDGRRRVVLMAAATLAFAAALFCKESGVVFLPLVLTVTVFLVLRGDVKWDRQKTIWFALWAFVVAAYVALKFTVFNFGGSLGLTGDENLYTENLHVRLFTYVSVLWDYFKLVVAPWHLYYEKPYTAYPDLWTWRGAFGTVVVFVALYVLVRCRRHPRAFLGMGLFFSGMAPYVGIIPLNAMYLEHWLYIPMLGVAVLVASGWRAAWNAMRVGGSARGSFATITVMVLVILAGRTVHRNQQWADIELFYLNELEYASSARIHNNLGMYYADKGNREKAIEHYKAAATQGKQHPQPYHNMGTQYLLSGKLNEAVISYHKALQINPRFIYSLRQLYLIFTNLKDQKRAAAIAAIIQKVEAGQPYHLAEVERLLFAH